MITGAWAKQEKVFVVLNPSLAEAHAARALKSVSKSAMITVAWAKQEKVFAVFNPSLAARALKSVSKSMSTKVAKLNS